MATLYVTDPFQRQDVVVIVIKNSDVLIYPLEANTMSTQFDTWPFL